MVEQLMVSLYIMSADASKLIASMPSKEKIVADAYAWADGVSSRDLEAAMNIIQQTLVDVNYLAPEDTTDENSKKKA